MGRLLIPQTLALQSTNVASSPYAEWLPARTYATGERVSVSLASDSTTPRFPVHEYEAKRETAGAYPPDHITDWLDLGIQNAHQLLDRKTDQRCIADAGEDLALSVVPQGRARYLYLIGLRNVASVQIDEHYNGAVQHSHVINMMLSYSPVGMTAYLEDVTGIDRSYRRSLAVPLLGNRVAPTLNITLASAAEGPAEAAQLLVGAGFELGPTEWGVEPGLRDFSTFEQNTFAETTHVVRRTTRQINGTIWIETYEYDRVFSLFETQMGTLALYDFNNNDDPAKAIDALRVYGKLDALSGGIAYQKTPLNLKILGL